MIKIKSNADIVARNLRELAARFPDEYPKAFRTLAVTFRSRIIKLMKKGDSSIVPLHPLSMAIKKRKGYGGKLQSAVRYKVTGKSPDLSIIIGFINEPEIAKKFMTGIKHRLSKAERRKWHITAGYAKKHGNTSLVDAISKFLSEGYNKPQREFVLPVYQQVRDDKEAVRIVGGRIKAMINKRLKNG